MANSLWGFAFLAFIAPGVAYLNALGASARIRRSVQRDAFFTVAALTLAAISVNGIVLLLDALLNGPFLGQLAIALTSKACESTAGNPSVCETQLKSSLEWFVIYGIVAVVFGVVLGVGTAKFIVWGFIPLGTTYGPLYPFLKGWYRREILATVISRMPIKLEETKDFGGKKTSKKTELPIAYRGTLEEIRLASNGRIEYLVLKNPEKAFFHTPPPNGDFVLIEADQFDEAEMEPEANVDVEALLDDLELEEEEKPAILRRLIIEGEDIQNIYVVRHNVNADDPSRENLKTNILTSIEFVRSHLPILFVLLMLGLLL